MIQTNLLLLLVTLLPFTVSAQRIQSAINEFANHPALKHGQLSVALLDIETGKLIAGHRPEKTMIPASSLKVMITGIALKKLGAAYRFKTELGYDGKITKDGVLQGNLIIRGYGDPTLGSHHFKEAEPYDQVIRQWIAAIRKAGIKKIEGTIIGDASYFGTQTDGRTWLWEDLGNYYGAGAWGLNFHENLYLLDLKRSSRTGAAPVIGKIEPDVPNLYLVNELKQAAEGSGDNAYIFGASYGHTRFVRGTIPIGRTTFTIKGAVPDPPFFAAYQLMKNLEKAGIATQQSASSAYQLKEEGVKIGTPKVIHKYRSPELKRIVKETNLKSINLYCEALLRLLGKLEKGEGSPEAGLEVVYEFMEENKLAVDGLFLEDASGLSSRNAVSAFHLADFLVYMKKKSGIYNDFKQSLPVGGKSGALKYLFRGTKGENKVFAKSGGMTRVRSYSGYVQNQQGKWLAFSIIANNFTGKSNIMRREMEKVMIRFCE